MLPGETTRNDANQIADQTICLVSGNGRNRVAGDVDWSGGAGLGRGQLVHVARPGDVAAASCNRVIGLGSMADDRF